MKVARQFTAWNAFTKKARTVGHGLSWSTDGFAIQVENVPSHPIIPFPTGRVRFLASPGSKLPGYDHLVPPGQKAFPRPVHKIASTSIFTAATRRQLQSEYFLDGLKSCATPRAANGSRTRTARPTEPPGVSDDGAKSGRRVGGRLSHVT